MIIYQILEEQIQNDEIGQYTSFGITAIDENTNKFVANISDVFNNEESAKKYVSLFNKEHLEIIHLKIVIDNILQLG